MQIFIGKIVLAYNSIPMKRLALLAYILMHCISAYAQYNSPYNFVWTFGTNALVDFSSGTPVGGSSSINTVEGCASVANSAGQLLFYTDGKTVYNRTGATMPSGISIVPAYVVSTTQSSVIVPFVDDTSKYYLFSLSHPAFTPWTGFFKLSYSIIDMSLDGGMGDVVAGTANTFLADTMSEKMIAIAGNRCNIWLLVHKPDQAIFYVYEITASGISQPAIYNQGFFTPPPGTPTYGNGYHLGTMRCSHNRDKLFLSCVQGGSVRGTGELYDFDPLTGVVSNCRTFSSFALYDAEFSPDDSKLYVTNLDSLSIEQYDLSLPTTPAIVASRMRICGTAEVNTALRLGPDGKIYASTMGNTTLDCIPYPNATGLACGYLTNVVNIAPGFINMGLPNQVWKVFGVGPVISGPTEVCIGDTVTLYNSVPGGVWVSSDWSIAAPIVNGLIKGISAGTVTITYRTAEGECFASRTLTVIDCGNTTSVSGNTAAAVVNIYPVPAGDNITVQLGTQAPATLTLHDVTGRQVYTATLSQKVSHLNIAHLAPGTYHCTVSVPGSPQAVRKVVVRQ